MTLIVFKCLYYNNIIICFHMTKNCDIMKCIISLLLTFKAKPLLGLNDFFDNMYMDLNSP